MAYLSTETIIKTFNSVPKFFMNWTLFMANRWMRITPYVMAVAWSAVTVFPLLVDGWNYTLTQGIFIDFFHAKLILLIKGNQRLCEQNLKYSFFYLDGWLHGVEGIEGFGFCNGVQWYLSCDFFYFALFPIMAVAYGKHKVISRNFHHMTNFQALGVSLVLFCTCGSIAHNMYSSLVSKNYIFQTYRVYTAWPQDRLLDPYMPPWARYHSHGVGVLFGWVLLAERRNKIISSFLNRRKTMVRFALVSFAWIVTLASLWWLIFGPNYCFRVNWTEEGKFMSKNVNDSSELNSFTSHTKCYFS